MRGTTRLHPYPQATTHPRLRSNVKAVAAAGRSRAGGAPPPAGATRDSSKDAWRRCAAAGSARCAATNRPRRWCYRASTFEEHTQLHIQRGESLLNYSVCLLF
ncbi:uncharacterized protein [Triticum aestivum]|uniref:uncharacterized protein n=1 Tax=Triticum aestivum TaxID=4565 RepID=UPI00098A8D02|nr:uncharacterized protein LOC109735731 [Aegilops tauschii subsp. strangulata]XP_044359561.1 uncharacterized protein LOC123080692 [Triticum aestivum]